MTLAHVFLRCSQNLVHFVVRRERSRGRHCPSGGRAGAGLYLAQNSALRKLNTWKAHYVGSPGIYHSKLHVKHRPPIICRVHDQRLVGVVTRP